MRRCKLIRVFVSVAQFQEYLISICESLSIKLAFSFAAHHGLYRICSESWKTGFSRDNAHNSFVLANLSDKRSVFKTILSIQTEPISSVGIASQLAFEILGSILASIWPISYVVTEFALNTFNTRLGYASTGKKNMS